MKTTTSYPIDNENFVMAYRTQTEWRWLITCAFFLGGLGAGLFMISLFTGYFAGAVAGWLVAVAGKGIAHLLYLGNPLRFWRAVMRPQTSWISRGMLGMLMMAGFGFLYLVLAAAGVEGGALRPIAVLAGLGAFIVMIYDGFVLATPPSIALWHSALLPILAGAYALLGGATGILVLSELGVGQAVAGGTLELLHEIELVLVVFNIAILTTLLMVGWSASNSARESVLLLLRRYRWQFFGGVIFVGLLASGLLSLYWSTNPSLGVLLVVGLFGLVGDFFVWFSLLHVGVYAPIITRASFAR
jgi:sulfite dehydrogenase (quinone) subunit SoeC